MLKFRLYPLMDADGAASGVATTQDGTDGAGQENVNAQDGSDQEGDDGRKTGEDDVKSQAQKIADAMVAKKLKGMPSKDELAAFKKWQEDQKTETEKLVGAQKAAEAAQTEALAKEAKADAVIAAVGAGIKPEHIEDAVILATARATDDITIEDAIAQVAKSNPAWIAGVKLPDNGGNPATNEKDKSEPPMLI